MPGISDPGGRLRARQRLTSTTPFPQLPGPSAEVMALVISGLPTTRYVFEGFLPRSGSERAERLKKLAGERRTWCYMKPRIV